MDCKIHGVTKSPTRLSNFHLFTYSPDHLTCLLKNLCEGQDATVRTGHGNTDRLKIGKGV